MAWCFDEILKQANSNFSSHFHGLTVFQITEKKLGLLREKVSV